MAHRTHRSHPAPAWMLALLLLVGAAGLNACASADSDDASTDLIASFDEDVDPELLAQYEGKYDGYACADHPDGELGGDDLLVIVNKVEERQLRADWLPSDLVSIDANSMMPGRTGLARAAVMNAYYELAEAARLEAGLDLGIRSAYRSYTTQCYTFNYKVETSGYDHAAKFSARPGRSEHQLGTAIDITSAALSWRLTQAMGDSAEGLWLADNAHRWGFALSYPLGYEDRTGYAYEPWHWRYIGREAAAEMAANGMILLDYLEACERGDAGLVCPEEEPPSFEPNQGFVGGACTSDSECATIGAGATCLTDADGYPEGHCTFPCSLYCPDRAGSNAPTFCVVDALDPMAGACHSRCDAGLFPASGCREGYVCTEASRPNNAGMEQVCLPALSE